MREKTIKEMISELKGIAKTRWLEKWAKWISSLLGNYDADPDEVLGFSDPYNIEKLEGFLSEYCSDLIESECLRKVEELIREKGFKRKMSEEMAESVMDYLKSIEKKPEVVYGLPSAVRAEIEDIRARPELDGAKAYSIVYNFLVGEGADPEDAKRVAQEIANTIPKIPTTRRAEVLETVMAVARLSRQRTLDEYAKKKARAEEMVSKELRKLNERVVYSLLEDLNMRGISPTVDELKKELLKEGYDVSNLDDIIRSLRDSDMLIVEDSKLVLSKYRRKIPSEVELRLGGFIRIVPGEPMYYVKPTKNLVEFLSELFKRGYTVYERADRCLDWFGAYEGWDVYLFSDSYTITNIPYVRSAWKVDLGSGTHYFVAVRDKFVNVYKCVK